MEPILDQPEKEEQYAKAVQDILEARKSVSALSPEQKKRLAEELFSADSFPRWRRML